MITRTCISKAFLYSLCFIILAFNCVTTFCYAVNNGKKPKIDHHVPPVVKKEKSNVVYICKNSLAPEGSGCLISSSGLLLTNWHVVLKQISNNKNYHIKVDWAPWGIKNEGTVIYVAPEFDLALIKLDKAPDSEGIRFAEKVQINDRIYPIGFTSGKLEGATRRWWGKVGGVPKLGIEPPLEHSELLSTIDTGNIIMEELYSYENTWRNPPLGYTKESWTIYIDQALAIIDKAHLRQPLTSDQQLQVFKSTAWVTGGQSGGPCLGEDGRLIALNHAATWTKGTFNESLHIPLDIIKLFIVGIQDNGEINRPIIKKFDEIGGAKVTGLSYALDGHPFVKKRGNGVIQEFRMNGHDSGIALHNGMDKAYWIHGAIWARWSSRGGPSYIGYPVSDEYDVDEGRQQDFERGTLTWVKAINTVFLTPNITPPPAAPDGILTTVHGYAAPAGNTLLPLRGIAEWCNALMTYDVKSKTIFCEGSDININLTLGGKEAIVVSRNGTRTISLAQPVTEIDCVILVPLHSICEAFYVKVTPFIISGYGDAKVRVVKISEFTKTGLIFIHDVPPSDVNAIRQLLRISKDSGLKDYKDKTTIIYIYNPYQNYVKADCYMFGYSDDSKWDWCDGWELLRKKGPDKWEVLFSGSDTSELHNDLRKIGVSKNVLAHYDIQPY